MSGPAAHPSTQVGVTVPGGLLHRAGAAARRAGGREDLAVLGLLAFAFFVYNVRRWWDSPGDDWSSIWIAAAMVAGGRSDALYSLNPHRFTAVGDPTLWQHFAQLTGYHGAGHPYVHEPGLAYGLSALAGSGSWTTSLHVLLVLDVLAMLGTVWLIGRTWAQFLLQPVPAAIVLLVLSLSEPLRYGLWLGQTTPVIIFLTVAAAALVRHHPLLAGLVLALPVSVKVTPVLIASYWLLDRRRWKALLGLAVGIAVLVLVQSVVIPGAVLSDYVTTLRHVQQTTTTGFSNQSLPAWIVNFSVHQPPGTYPTRPVPTWVNVLSTGALLATVAVVLLRAHQVRRLGRDPELWATAALLTASLPFQSLSWTHYYLLLLVPAAVVLTAARSSGLRWPYAVVAALVALDMQPLAVNGPANMGGPDSLLRGHLLAGVLALVAVLALPTRAMVGASEPTAEGQPVAAARRPPVPLTEPVSS